MAKMRADPVAAREQAGRWAERAVAMDDADGQAHTVLGNVRLLQRRFDEALAVAREAREIRLRECQRLSRQCAALLRRAAAGDPACASRDPIQPIYPPWFIEILSASYRDAGMPDLGAIAARETLRIVPAAIEARLLQASALRLAGGRASRRGRSRYARRKADARTVGAFAALRDREAFAAVMDDLRRAGIRPSS